jgi:hypothetical protein
MGDSRGADGSAAIHNSKWRSVHDDTGERVNNPECRVAILSLDQLRVWAPKILLVAADEVIE